MKPVQLKLATGFKDFMTVLQNLPIGTPDLHIGVVSSSLGAGRNPSLDQCMPGGDHGILQSAPRGQCAQTGLSDAFIALHTDQATGQLVTNYGAQAVPDVFSCIALLGDTGCDFEHQLASERQALDPALAPPENAGFLRAYALLAVILVTNEDDCSAPPDSDLFDSNVTNDPLTEPLEPLQSYRCNEFGHVCLIDGKLQHPPARRRANFKAAARRKMAASTRSLTS